MRHRSVRQCAVVPHGHSDERCLVAYVVAQDGIATSEAELRAHLAAQVPAHMVPGAFVILPKMPLLPNGKIDRKSLPPPPGNGSLSRGSTVAPSTPTEQALANIFQDLLKLPQVGIHDDFFELGGHSLHAMRAISRIRTALGVAIEPHRFFERPTIAGISRCIAEQANQRQDAGGSGQPMAALLRDRPLPASFAQQRLWFLSQYDVNPAVYNMCFAVHLAGPLDAEILAASLRRLVQRHESLRTTFRMDAGQVVQVIAAESELPLPITDLTGLSADERRASVQSLTQAEARSPFNLVQGPLIRAALLRTEPDQHVLILNMHHIVSDGWSNSILFDELARIYCALRSGQADALPALALQHADFSGWQREYLRGEKLQEHLTYWRTRLEGAPALLEMPTDRPRPSVQTYRGDRLSLLLPQALSDALAQLCGRLGLTPFMPLVAAFKVLLYRYSGQQDLVIGAAVAGRSRPETEDMVGFFVNSLPLRTRLADDLGVEELLGRVRQTLVGAYAHQDLPLQQIVEGTESPAQPEL